MNLYMSTRQHKMDRLQRLVPLILLVFSCLAAQAAQWQTCLNIQVTAGLAEQGYGNEDAQAGYYLPWGGGSFTAETQLISQQAAKESWQGIYLADTAHGHRYTVGVVTDHSGRSQLGAVSFQNMSNARVLKFGDINDKELLTLRVQFTKSQENPDQVNALAIWAQDAGGNWTLLRKLTLLDNISINRVGLSVDSFASRAPDPAVFKYFNLTGDGKQQYYNFVDNGKLEAWKPSNDRVQIKVNFMSSLELPKEENVFDAGGPIALTVKLGTVLLQGQEVTLKTQVLDTAGLEVYSKDTPVVFSQNEVTQVVDISEWDEEKGIFTVLAGVEYDGKILAQRSKRIAVITPQPGPYELELDSPFGMCWVVTQPGYYSSLDKVMPLAARLGIKWNRVSWFDWERKKVNGIWDLSRYYRIIDSGLQYGIMTLPILEIASDFTSLIETSQKAYGEKLPVYELLNEPEGRPLEVAAKTNAETTAFIREHYPSVRTTSSGTTHVNLGLLGTIMDYASDPFDIANVHFYRTPCAPELLMKDDVKAVREITGNKPIWISEASWFTSNQPLGVSEATQASYLARTYLWGMKEGIEKIFWYRLSDNDHGLFYWNGEPKPSLVAYNAMTAILGSTPVYLEEITKFGPELKILRFKAKTGDVTAMWSLNEEYDLSVETELDSYFDLYGNRRNIASQKGKKTLRITEAPIYLPGALAAEQLLTAIVVEERPEFPQGLEIRILPHVLSMEESQLCVYLKNHSSRSLEGAVALDFANAGTRKVEIPEDWKLEPVAQPDFNLAPGQEAEIYFAPQAAGFDPYHPDKGYLLLWWVEGYYFTATARLKDGSKIEYNNGMSQAGLSLRGISKVDSPLTIDTDWEKWKDVPGFDLSQKVRANVGAVKTYREVEGFLPIFKVQWDDEYLYLMARVQDDRHHQPYADDRMWWVDSFDLAIDVEPENKDPLSYYYFTVGLSENGCNVYRRLNSYGHPEAKLEDVKAAGKRDDGFTYYELAIPWRQLAPFTPEKGKYLKLGIQFNESDGQYRLGWTGWFVNMGGHLVDKNFLGDLTLVD